MKKLNEAGHEMEIGPKYNCGGFEEFWYVPLKWKEKKRWAGVMTLSRKKSTDVVRVQHVDLYSGWAASADNPKTLAPFEKAVEMLHGLKIEYLVYIPDGDDDPELVEQINARLCPVELKTINGPTYSDLVRAEEAQLDPGPDALEPTDFVPYITDHVFGSWPDEIELISYPSLELAEILNTNDEETAKVPCTAEWVESVLDTAIKAEGQYVVFKIIGRSIRITREVDQDSEVSYWFEKISSGQPYPY